MYSMVYCLTIFEATLARPVKRFSYIGTILRWISVRRKISTLHIQLFVLHQQSHSFSGFGQLGTFITMIKNHYNTFTLFGTIQLFCHKSQKLLSDSSIYLAHISCLILICLLLLDYQKVLIQESESLQNNFECPDNWHISHQTEKIPHLIVKTILHILEVTFDSISTSIFWTSIQIKQRRLKDNFHTNSYLFKILWQFRFPGPQSSAQFQQIHSHFLANSPLMAPPKPSHG